LIFLQYYYRFANTVGIPLPTKGGTLLPQKIKMEKYKNLVFTIILASGLFAAGSASAEEFTLTQKEAADLAKPSVVKIVQRVKGSAEIPAIDIDFKALSVMVKKDLQPQKVEIDEYLTGTGIIVTPDGYVMTNSHVVSYQTIKNLIVSDYIYQAIDDGYAKLNEEEAKSVSENKGQEEMAKFGEKIADFILGESKFDIEKTITVLNPSSKKETLEELISDSFSASVISVNDNFFRDSRDAALLKIDQQGLPAIDLGSSLGVSTGKKVYIFGYPSTAEMSEKDLLEPTFTQGTISATKDSMNKDFKIFQTDAKISRGSSGGPLLDEQGKVVGLVTFITNDLTKQDGDSFAFAIPIDTVKNIISESKITGELSSDKIMYQSGGYNKYFLSGLAFLKKNQCQKAMADFNLAKQGNDSFNINVYLDSYVKQCEDIIISGRSVDTAWGSFKSNLGDTKYLVLVIIVAGVVLVFALASAWFWLFRRMRHDEKELDSVEEFLNLDVENGKPKEN